VIVRWLPWQQLQLALCCVNNFYVILSSNVARTIPSNGIDIGRCLSKLLIIICVSGFFGTQCRVLSIDIFSHSITVSVCSTQLSHMHTTSHVCNLTRMHLILTKQHISW